MWKWSHLREQFDLCKYFLLGRTPINTYHAVLKARSQRQGDGTLDSSLYGRQLMRIFKMATIWSMKPMSAIRTSPPVVAVKWIVCGCKMYVCLLRALSLGQDFFVGAFAYKREKKEGTNTNQRDNLVVSSQDSTLPTLHQQWILFTLTSVTLTSPSSHSMAG